MTREEWRYLVEVLLSEPAQQVLGLVLEDEIGKRNTAMRNSVKQSDWHAAAQHLGRIDQLSELPNLLRRYAEDHPGGVRK